MFRKVLLYGLPIYLYGLELLLKSLASISADSVAGPTLAGAGIGFLLPLTELKQIDLEPSLAARLKTLSASVYSARDKKFTDLVWVTFFAALAAWMYSLYLTFRPTRDPNINWPFTIGCAIFVIAILYCEIKERI